MIANQALPTTTTYFFGKCGQTWAGILLFLNPASSSGWWHHWLAWSVDPSQLSCIFLLFRFLHAIQGLFLVFELSTSPSALDFLGH
jgi:hypothetical protein